MAHIAVLGAGLGGTILAYALREELGKAHRISVVTKGTGFGFVPSNPWVAVGWRDRAAVEVDLARPFAQHDIALHPQGAGRLRPAERRIELGDGASLDYDYLVIATGPELAFDEVEGLEPEPDARATWNAVCLADFGDSGIALVARPQIPPRNVNWSSSGRWVHAAKIGFEKYFLHKVRSGKSEPFYEKFALQALGIDKLKAIRFDQPAE